MCQGLILLSMISHKVKRTRQYIPFKGSRLSIYSECVRDFFCFLQIVSKSKGQDKPYKNGFQDSLDIQNVLGISFTFYDQSQRHRDKTRHTIWGFKTLQIFIMCQGLLLLSMISYKVKGTRQDMPIGVSRLSRYLECVREIFCFLQLVKNSKAQDKT